jgi:hypothetical protein
VGFNWVFTLSDKALQTQAGGWRAPSASLAIRASGFFCFPCKETSGEACCCLAMLKAEWLAIRIAFHIHYLIAYFAGCG